MSDLGTVRFGGRDKWGDVAVNVVLTVLAAVFAVGVYTQVPHDVHPMQALAWYTVWAGALTAALTVALAVTDRLPVVGHGQVDGSPADGVRAWPGDRLYDLGLDAGLAAVAAVITVMGLVAGGEWIVPSLLVAVVGAWFGGRAVLRWTGRWHDEALWLTDDSLVHDSRDGRERCSRTQITRVRPVGRIVLVTVEGTIERQPTPRVWRPRKQGSLDQKIRFDTERVGHTPEQLSTWLCDELGIDEHGRPTRTTRS